MSSRTALLGSDELDRLFPERKMKIFVCTWNMCEMKVRAIVKKKLNDSRGWTKSEDWFCP